MHLAYYEEKDYHTEIMGLFLDYCIKGSHTCDLFNNKDQSAFLAHYETILNINKLNRYKNAELFDKIDKYDFVIIGTMGGINLSSINELIKLRPKKFIQIYHNDDDLKIKKMSILTNKTKTIVLTPLNLRFGPYLLPIFSSECVKINQLLLGREKIIAVVGRFTQHRTYEVLLPLLKLDYTIWIISRKPKFVPEALVNLSKTESKIKISYRLNAQKMSEILRKSRFLLCMVEADSWYYKDRLTGTIPLSYNYNLPIIIPKQLNDIYEINSAIEYDNPESIPDSVREIDDNKYNNILVALNLRRNEISTKNNKVLDSVFDLT